MIKCPLKNIQVIVSNSYINYISSCLFAAYSDFSMASTNRETNHSEESHESRVEKLSNKIRRIAFKKQQITKAFEKGEEVEVASQEYGFIGSYYLATIVSSIGAYHYKIKYKTLLTNDKSAPLEEIVNVTEVRPVPPVRNETMPENGSFHIHDVVDVFANDGWWIGFISGIIGDEYYVYFPTTADNVAYPPEVLRCHQEWFNGKWKLV